MSDHAHNTTQTGPLTGAALACLQSFPNQSVQLTNKNQAKLHSFNNIPKINRYKIASFPPCTSPTSAGSNLLATTSYLKNLIATHPNSEFQSSARKQRRKDFLIATHTFVADGRLYRLTQSQLGRKLISPLVPANAREPRGGIPVRGPNRADTRHSPLNQSGRPRE